MDTQAEEKVYRTELVATSVHWSLTFLIAGVMLWLIAYGDLTPAKLIPYTGISVGVVYALGIAKRHYIKSVTTD